MALNNDPKADNTNSEFTVVNRASDDTLLCPPDDGYLCLFPLDVMRWFPKNNTKYLRVSVKAPSLEQSDALQPPRADFLTVDSDDSCLSVTS